MHGSGAPDGEFNSGIHHHLSNFNVDSSSSDASSGSTDSPVPLPLMGIPLSSSTLLAILTTALIFLAVAFAGVLFITSLEVCISATQHIMRRPTSTAHTAEDAEEVRVRELPNSEGRYGISLPTMHEHQHLLGDELAQENQCF